MLNSVLRLGSVERQNELTPLSEQILDYECSGRITFFFSHFKEDRIELTIIMSVQGAQFTFLV